MGLSQAALPLPLPRIAPPRTAPCCVNRHGCACNYHTGRLAHLWRTPTPPHMRPIPPPPSAPPPHHVPLHTRLQVPRVRVASVLPRPLPSHQASRAGRGQAGREGCQRGAGAGREVRAWRPLQCKPTRQQLQLPGRCAAQKTGDCRALRSWRSNLLGLVVSPPPAPRVHPTFFPVCVRVPLAVRRFGQQLHRTALQCTGLQYPTTDCNPSQPTAQHDPPSSGPALCPATCAP